MCEIDRLIDLGLMGIGFIELIGIECFLQSHFLFDLQSPPIGTEKS